MKKIFTLVIIIFTIGCQKKNILEPSGKVEFKNALNGNYRYFGSFKEKDKSIVFFGDLMTQKKIYFHNETGQLIDSISFNNQLLQDGDFHLNIISRDTFLLTDKKSIFALNKKSEIIKRIVIDSLLKDLPNVYHYKMPYNLYGDQLKENIFMSIDWRKTKSKNRKNLSIDKFCETSFSNPNLLVLDNLFSDKPSYKLHPKNYYQYLFHNYGSFAEGFYPYFLNENYMISTNYSDKILIFNKNLAFKKLIKITSLYVSSNRAKPIISETKNFKHPRIQNVFYSEISEKYFVILRHSLKENDLKYRLSRPFSLITLDKNFKKLDEKAIFDDSYTNHLSFNVNDKIYIKQNLKDESKNVFSVF